MLRSLVPLLAVCLVAGSTASLAAGPTLDARYSVETMGVDVGRATLQVERATEGLAARFRFETAALLGLVEETDTRMETLASGMRDALRPKRFVGVYKKEDRTREVDMAYGANGAIDAFTLKKRGSVRIGAVPTGLAEDTLDPIAAFLRAAGEMSAKGTFTYAAEAASPKDVTPIFDSFSDGRSSTYRSPPSSDRCVQNVARPLSSIRASRMLRKSLLRHRSCVSAPIGGPTTSMT